MKRLRRCCCCRPGEVKIVATSSNTSGAWDLTPYQSKTFKKYKGKYWDVWQRRSLANGRVGGDGTLTGLPDSVTLINGAGNAYLRVRCSPACNDTGAVGEMLMTNEGVEGNTWDMSGLIGMPAMVGGGEIGIRTYSANLSQGSLMTTVDANGKILTVSPSIITTGGAYSEAFIRCNNLCVPSPVQSKNESFVLDAGCYGDLVTTYKDAVGVAPPGSGWRLHVWQSNIFGYYTNTVIAAGVVGAAGNLIGFPVSGSEREAVIEIATINVCKSAKTTKDRIARQSKTGTKTALATYVNTTYLGPKTNYNYTFDYDIAAELAEVVASEGYIDCGTSMELNFYGSYGRAFRQGLNCYRHDGYGYVYPIQETSGTFNVTLQCNYNDLPNGGTCADLDSLCPFTEMDYGYNIVYYVALP